MKKASYLVHWSSALEEMIKERDEILHWMSWTPKKDRSGNQYALLERSLDAHNMAIEDIKQRILNRLDELVA